MEQHTAKVKLKRVVHVLINRTITVTKVEKCIDNVTKPGTRKKLDSQTDGMERLDNLWSGYQVDFFFVPIRGGRF